MYPKIETEDNRDYNLFLQYVYNGQNTDEIKTDISLDEIETLKMCNSWDMRIKQVRYKQLKKDKKEFRVELTKQIHEFAKEQEEELKMLKTALTNKEITIIQYTVAKKNIVSTTKMAVDTWSKL